jgi:hypothetical protein
MRVAQVIFPISIRILYIFANNTLCLQVGDSARVGEAHMILLPDLVEAMLAVDTFA